MGEIRAEYAIPKECEVCGSDDLVVRVIYDTGITRYICMSCGWGRNLPKLSNLNKRTNTSLENWAKQIKKKYPSCVICGCTVNLEAHHIIPVSHSERFKYMHSNGIALCKKCHYLVHNKEKPEGR